MYTTFLEQTKRTKNVGCTICGVRTTGGFRNCGGSESASGFVHSPTHTPLNDMAMKDERRTNTVFSFNDVVASEARRARRLDPVLLVCTCPS